MKTLRKFGDGLSASFIELQRTRTTSKPSWFSQERASFVRLPTLDNPLSSNEYTLG